MTAVDELKETEQKTVKLLKELTQVVVQSDLQRTEAMAHYVNPAVPDKHVSAPRFDVCHMIKLLRNALAMYKTFSLPGKREI